MLNPARFPKKKPELYAARSSVRGKLLQVAFGAPPFIETDRRPVSGSPSPLRLSERLSLFLSKREEGTPPPPVIERGLPFPCLALPPNARRSIVLISSAAAMFGSTNRKQQPPLLFLSGDSRIPSHWTLRLTFPVRL